MGVAKRYTRENCSYTWESPVKTVPLALDSVSLNSICKFERKLACYIDCYRKGFNIKQVVIASFCFLLFVFCFLLYVHSIQAHSVRSTGRDICHPCPSSEGSAQARRVVAARMTAASRHSERSYCRAPNFSPPCLANMYQQCSVIGWACRDRRPLG